MIKEDLTCLIGKYLNGYKIVKIENDPFIKGQINLFTDEWEYEAFNDRCLVKFFVRNNSNDVKIYKELIDKEKYKLKQALIKIIEYINTTDTFVLNGEVMKLKDEMSGQDILKIINDALGDDKE